MLFSYKYINHEIEKFQKVSDFLFLEVWLQAKKPFDANVFRRNPELKKIYLRLQNEDSEGAEFFNRYVEGIYEDCRPLSKKERQLLKKWYKLNNQISRLCQDRTVAPVSYKKLKNTFPSIGKQVETFYKKLYGKGSPFKLAAFGNIDKVLKKHYNAFMTINDEEICPFCGINLIKGKNHKKKEAYDHFIPKGKYPFNSINFKNLAPMCHECNSSYKLEKEPLLHLDPVTNAVSHNRRRAFYPYSEKKWELNTKVSLSKTDFNNLDVDDIELDFQSINQYSHKDQIEGWREVYGIDERYKAKLLSKRGIRKWFNEFNELENLKRLEPEKAATIELLYSMKIKEIEADPLDNANFIKKAFLEDCNRKKLLTMGK